MLRNRIAMNQITSERIALIRQIHEAAKAQGLSMYDLSDRTGLTGKPIRQPHIYKYLSGENMTLDSFLRLAHAAGCRVRIEKDDAVGHGI